MSKKSKLAGLPASKQSAKRALVLNTTIGCGGMRRQLSIGSGGAMSLYTSLDEYIAR
ncbi:MAG: hypothetical protein [Arizlama microvirus]|nr:MAG: hypothetical protein [Arizlama microvirus]